MRWGAKRYGTLEERFWRHVSPEPNSGCWLWDGPCDDFGYGRFRVGRAKKRVHRIAYEMLVGEVPDGLILRHRCDVPCCVNPAHLLTGTVADNNRDRSMRGRTCSGERNPWSKLTLGDVRAIRQSAETHRALGARFGVSHGVVGAIKRGEKWAYDA